MDLIGLPQPSRDARSFVRRRAVLVETPVSPYWAHHFSSFVMDLIGLPQPSRDARSFVRRRAVLVETPVSPYWAHHYPFGFSSKSNSPIALAHPWAARSTNIVLAPASPSSAHHFPCFIFGHERNKNRLVSRVPTAVRIA